MFCMLVFTAFFYMYIQAIQCPIRQPAALAAINQLLTSTTDLFCQIVAVFLQRN